MVIWGSVVAAPCRRNVVAAPCRRNVVAALRKLFVRHQPLVEQQAFHRPQPVAVVVRAVGLGIGGGNLRTQVVREVRPVQQGAWPTM